MTIANILLAGCSIGIAYSLAMIVRNNYVYQFRRKISDEIVFTDEPGWPERLMVYRAGPSYSAMVHQFWRPLTVEEWFGDTFDELARNRNG